jgi:hypothetical protein
LWKASFIAPPSRFEFEHSREHPRRLALRDVFEIGDQRDGIAATVAGREVGQEPAREPNKRILKEPGR